MLAKSSVTPVLNPKSTAAGRRGGNNMNRTTRLLIAVVASCTLLAGCASEVSENSEKDQHRSLSTSFHDATTTASVKITLAFKPGVRAVDVDVDTNRGTVTLYGEVRTEAERQLAAKVAEDVSGVREVVNHIQVRG
jgi:osmotically-inducible protein OsmY